MQRKESELQRKRKQQHTQVLTGVNLQPLFRNMNTSVDEGHITKKTNYKNNSDATKVRDVTRNTKIEIFSAGLTDKIF